MRLEQTTPPPPPPSLATDNLAATTWPAQDAAEQEETPAAEPSAEADVAAPDAPESNAAEVAEETREAPVAEATQAPEATDAPASLESLLATDDASAISDVVQVDRLTQMAGNALSWVQTNILTINMALQLGIIVGAIVPALIFGPRLKRLIQRQLRERTPPGILRRAVDALATVATLIALWIILSIAIGILSGVGQSNFLVSAVQSLLAAAIFIRLVTLVIRSPFWSRVAFYVAWPIAALDAFGILDNVVSQLEAASIPLGENSDGSAITLSALDVVRAGIIFLAIFWLVSFVKGLGVRQLDRVDELNASIKALLVKIIDFITPIFALILALNIIGFNLASLAVFSGAVGLGIGLGLQKIIANFLAGFTLLADKSIKPGDVIEVDDVFGWVTEMKSRYVSVRTRDGHEQLIPNAIFIDEGVVNWSHSDRAVRVHAPFGIDYGTQDLRSVQEMAVECASGVERVLDTPKPVCNLMAFGESSVDFDLRFWINDPQNGVSNVRSDVLLRIWDALHERGIPIPFRQLDVHIKSGIDPEQLAMPSAAE